MHQILTAQLALSVERAGEQIVLRWTSDSPNDVLEASDELGPDAKWTNAGVQPIIIGDQREVTLPGGATQRFYRVRSQP